MIFLTHMPGCPATSALDLASPAAQPRSPSPSMAFSASSRLAPGRSYRQLLYLRWGPSTCGQRQPSRTAQGPLASPPAADPRAFPPPAASQLLGRQLRQALACQAHRHPRHGERSAAQALREAWRPTPSSVSCRVSSAVPPCPAPALPATGACLEEVLGGHLIVLLVGGGGLRAVKQCYA